MKFTAGFWEIRPGVTPTYPVQVHEVEVDPEGMTVYAATKALNHRGDTLNLPLLSVRYTAPLRDVIRVQVCHHKGGLERGPAFQFTHEPGQATVRDEADHAELTSGQLVVRVEKKAGWKVEFRAGERVLTNSAWRNLAMMDAPEGRFMLEQLALGVGECVYGLGERFTPFVKNGQIVEMWNEDGGTASEIAYKNIPFYLTNRGYGVFVNHPEMVSFEVGSEKVERVQFSVPGEKLDYFIIYGATPADILERYTALTGRPALPPAWSFGLWLTTSFTTSYDEQTVTGFIQGMADRDLPLHVFHFDCFWMKEFHWVNFEWDQRVFPDPQGMLRRLKERGLKICLWINPYIAERSALFAEGAASGYLLKRPDGSVFQWDRWQAGMALVDFTNPAARAWFAGKLSALVDMGVDCFKTDFGERIPTEVAYFDGSDPLKMHNYYTQLYNQTVFELLETRLGKGQAAVFARSATVGGQQYPVHWGGDSTATFESMAESLRGGLSLSLSGFGFWSHDMGGFEQTASPDVYKRWCAFGLLSSHSRLHGSSSYRVPWLFDDEAVDVLRHFTRLKCRLMPYLYAAAVEAHQKGTPMMRAMPLAFPQDPGCDTIDRQYMLGPNLLVAPVLNADGVVDYYLPAGRWTHFLSGEVLEGGRWVRERHDFLSLPLLARPNSIVPAGALDTRPDYDYAAGITFHLFEIQDGARLSAEVPALDGETQATLSVERNGSQLKLVWTGARPDWKAILHGPAQVRSVEGGQVQPSAQSGVLLVPKAGTMIVEL
jgi:alpha-D-xyloside xylohydrolase